MLNALLTPLKAGLSFLSPQRPRTSATDDNLTTPPDRTSRAVTFNLHRPPPDDESPPEFIPIGRLLTSSSTRPQSDWRYHQNAKAGREGRKALMNEITASAAKYGMLNFKQQSYEKFVDVLTMPLKRNGIWHLLEIPKTGSGRVWPSYDPQGPLRIDLDDYSTLFLDHTLTFELHGLC